MAGKNFKGGMDSLLGGTKSKDTSEKRGRPKTNHKEVTKTSQLGTKENETRATFIVNETQLETIKAIAYWDRVSIKEILFDAIEDYLGKRKSDINKAVNAFKGKTKE